MLKFFRALTASATMILALSACATIETKGLPKCSGHDRRPLNADLWAWQETAPEDPPAESAPALKYSAEPGEVQSAALVAIETATSKPRWNIAASEKPCR